MGFQFNPDSFSELPGVYRMLADDLKVIYIGKAQNLRRRLSQYFLQDGDGRFQIDLLLKEVHHVETIVTDSERDALILENQLIKREKPRYNIRLKDDKTYPYIRISRDAFPRVDISRQKNDKDYHYFGPYTQVGMANRLVEWISSQFGIRRCPGIPLKMLDRPCLYAQVGQCSAPCVKKIDESTYAEDVLKSHELLKGRRGHLAQEAKKKMEDASENLDYERAAHFRDLFRSLKHFENLSVLEGGRHSELDLLAVVSKNGWDIISWIQVRGGELWSNETFQRRSLVHWEDDADSFLIELYSHREVPGRIVVDFHLNNRELLSEILSERAGYQVTCQRPQRGELRSWLSVARQNARAEASCREATGDLKGGESFLKAIQKECQLKHPPKWAIALDCANFSKEEPVGSVVSFRDGQPDKSGYRKFKVRGERGEQGDIFHVEEVLERFLSNLNGESPDLILIDGAWAQVEAAQRAIQRVQSPSSSDLMGISKDDHRSSGGETLHLWPSGRTLTLTDTPISMPLLTEMRDEAHRTSNRYNAQRLAKKRFTDPLEKLPGIGPKTTKVIRQRFGSIESLLNAQEQDILCLQGLNQRQKAMLLAFRESRRP